MGFKSNINPQARGFYYASSGDNGSQGSSLELPKKDIQSALDAANNLTPPPSTSDTAFVREAQGGLYIEDINLYDSVLFEGSQTTIVTTGLIGVSAADFASFRPQTLVNNTSNGTVLEVDGNNSFGANLTAFFVGGSNGKGVDIKGVCSDLFLTASQMVLSGESAIGVQVSGDCSTPIDINFNTVELSASNSAFMGFSPLSNSTFADVNISTLYSASGTTGTAAFNVTNGVIKVQAGSIQADDVATVTTGGVLSLSCNAIEGNTTVTNGACVYDSVGVISGDLSTSGSGTLQVRATNVNGNVTTSGTGGASLKCDQLIGNIDIGAGTSAYLVIDNHIGSITSSGNINGIINGVRYGNYKTITDSTVIVNNESDLPAPIGGKIQLEGDKRYWLKNGLTIANTLVMGAGTQLFGDGVFADNGVTITTTGNAIESSNVGFSANSLAITSPNATQLFSCSGSNLNSVFIDNFRGYNCTKLGTINGMPLVANNVSFTSFEDGFTFSGSNIFGFSIVNAFMSDTDNNATYFDFADATYLQMAFRAVEMQGSDSATYFSSDVNGANLVAGTDAVVSDCTFGIFGQGTQLSGFAEDWQTVGWEFSGNSPAALTQDSQEYADMFLLTSNTIAVTNPNEWYEIGSPLAGAWQSDIDDRFELNANGYLTYMGNKPLRIPVEVLATVDQSGFFSDLIEMRLAVNWSGSPTDSGIEKSLGQSQNTTLSQVASKAAFNIQPGDNIRPIFSNKNDTSDINVNVINMIVGTPK